jgi:hypothetical protein
MEWEEQRELRVTVQVLSDDGQKIVTETCPNF